MLAELRAAFAGRTAAPATRSLAGFPLWLGLPQRQRSQAPRRRPRAQSGAEIGRRARGRATRLNALAGLVVLAVGLFHVWTGLEVGQLGYALSDARILTQRLDEELHELTIEYAAETAPGRLEEKAREQLGLRPPAPGQVVILR